MSANHYPHMHSVNANRQKTDFGYPSNVHSTWSGNQPNEFENREQYMETQLAGEHDNCDSNANQNEILDDEPRPPPGLSRLVTGQTVSFDDGLNSPPFDRIVPGEGSSFNTYPLSSQAYNPSALSERFVSGSVAKGYTPVPQQMFPSVQKKETNTYNNNFYSDGNVYNSASQDFFDNYLHDNKPSSQPPKNKYAQPLPAYEPEKRDNFSRQEHPKPLSNVFDPMANKTANSHFQTGFQNRPQPVPSKPPVLRATENIQHDTSFQQRAFYVDQQHNVNPQRPYLDEPVPKYSEPEPKRNEPFDASTAANTSRLEAVEHDNFYESPAVDHSENKEKISFFQQNDFGSSQTDDRPYHDPSSNRMAVEGASDNVPYTKTVPSSTPMQSPSYDHWYLNNSQPSFIDFPEVKNAVAATQLPRKEPEASLGNRFQPEKVQHNLESAPSSQSHFPPAGGAAALISQELHVHSKTPSVSSNTSSANEISSYQQGEVRGNFEASKKRNEFYGEVDTTDRAAIKTIDAMAAKTIEPNAKMVSRGVHELSQNGHDSIDARLMLEQNREILGDEQRGQEHGDNLANAETSVPPRNAQPAFMESRDRQHVGGGAVAGAEGQDLTGFRKIAVANQERLHASDRGTVPGAQSTPNDGQTRSFSNSSANASFGYGLQNVTRVDEDEEERELPHTDSDERPVGQRMVVGYNYNTLPAARKNSAKLGRDSKQKIQYSSESAHKSNKVEPPLEQRMVVGETSSDVPLTSAAHRSRNDDRQFDDDRARRGGKDRGDTVRKQQHYDSRLDRRKFESDDEDYDSSANRTRDISPDRESRRNYNRHDKRSSRRNHENSFTQSQDESEEDDIYETSRNLRRYYEKRRPPRGPKYSQYDQDPCYPGERSYSDRRLDYPSFNETRVSRPSSRTESEYRRNLPDYTTNAVPFWKLPCYEYLDHRRILQSNDRIQRHFPGENWQFRSLQREEDAKNYARWFMRMFPKEYNEWYWRYCMPSVSMSDTRSYQADRRGSGHSGQSSVNNDSMSVSGEKLMNRGLTMFKPVESEAGSVIHEIRNTPSKFTIPHVKGLFNAIGQLLVVNPCSPLDGQSADVDIYQLSPPDDEPDCVELMNFTGPFIVGETHVNTVSEFVRYHADMASTLSEKLLYLLIDLIIKLRGVTDGIAISELLMNNYRESQKLNYVGAKDEIPKQSCGHSNLSEADVLEKYTNLLLQGDKNAALDWAISCKLWGHAFLLASKMGTKYYSNVLAKFDSSIPINNPLKTLYQLYSDQIPQAATACSDEKWGDWIPHLAMMLSNPLADSELDRSAIITLGDSLGCKDVFASHFCYLAAQADFDSPSKPSAKFSLLSLRNNVDHLGVDTSNHAILLTQAYEFAKRLQRKDYTISALLPYKYLLAVRLIDYGKNSVALQYLESIAIDLLKCRSDENADFAYNVLELSERIKYSDSKPLVADSSDKPWLTSLRQLVNGMNKSNGLQFTSLIDQHGNETPFSDQCGYQQQPAQTQLADQLPQGPVLQTPLQQHVQQAQQTPLYSVPAPGDGHQPFAFQMQAPPSQQQPASLPMPTQSQPWDPSSYGPNSRNVNSSRGYPQWGTNNSNNNNQMKSESLDMNDNVSLQQVNDYQQPSNVDPGGYHDDITYSPWDQHLQPTSVSMHSSSKSFYNDPDESTQANATRNVSRTNTSHSHHSLRTQQVMVVRDNVMSRHHRSTAKSQSYHVKRLRCKSFFAAAACSGGNPVAGELSGMAVRGLASRNWLADDGRSSNPQQRRIVSALYYDSLCNSKIVFNGTFPIDRPFGVRQSLCDASQQATSGEVAARSRREESAASQPKNKEAEKAKKDPGTENSNGSILNSFKNKLSSFLPGNRMKLPDDTNKSIVYDPQRKRWVDLKSNDGNDDANNIEPPPKVSDLQGFQQVPSDQGVRPGSAPTGQNPAPMPVSPAGTGYKLKGKGMRSNYVNVLSQNTVPAASMPANPMMPYPSAQVPPNMFMPSGP